MKRTKVAGWLKAITIVSGAVGFLFFLVLLPMLAETCARAYPAIAHLKWPGILYGWGIGALCGAILFQFWTVCVQIAENNSFSGENARAFRVISRLAMVLAAVWLAGVAALSIMRCLAPLALLCLVLVAFLFVVLAVLSAALSHLIDQAFALRQENELTI